LGFKLLYIINVVLIYVFNEFLAGGNVTATRHNTTQDTHITQNNTPCSKDGQRATLHKQYGTRHRHREFLAKGKKEVATFSI
jgi:hypothetical protein